MIKIQFHPLKNQEGTAIAWKKDIDHLIDDNIEEGNERIVCIRIKVKPKPILNAWIFYLK